MFEVPRGTSAQETKHTSCNVVFDSHYFQLFQNDLTIFYLWAPRNPMHWDVSNCET